MASQVAYIHKYIYWCAPSPERPTRMCIFFTIAFSPPSSCIAYFPAAHSSISDVLNADAFMACEFLFSKHGASLWCVSFSPPPLSPAQSDTFLSIKAPSNCAHLHKKLNFIIIWLGASASVARTLNSTSWRKIVEFDRCQLSLSFQLIFPDSPL